jgi:hypothetical protein
MTIDELLRLASQGAGGGLLAFFIIALVKRWVVLGWQYDAMVDERDRYRQLAERSLGVGEKVADVAKQAVSDGTTHSHD